MAVGTKPESFFSFRWLSERNLKIFFHSDGGRNQTGQFFFTPMVAAIKPGRFFYSNGCRNKT
jgi:hypothetical protein